MPDVSDRDRRLAGEAPLVFEWLGSHMDALRVLGVGTTGLSAAWSPLDGHVQGVGFDPLADSSVSAGDDCGWIVRSEALSAYGGEDELAITHDPDRSSLLEPNWGVIARHGSAAGFDICERRQVPTLTLAQVESEYGPFDVVRLRAQGLEYQLLSSGLATVNQAVCIEVEGGLVENYVGQYPLSVVAPLLQGAGYQLVGLTCAGSPRPGWESSAQYPPVEYRGLWLRDPLANGNAAMDLSQAATLIVLCRALGFLPLGHDVAVGLSNRSLIPPHVARMLRQARFWAMPWDFASILSAR